MIEQQYVDRHPGSAALARRAAPVLPNGVTHDSRHLRPFNVYINRAAGSRKWDVDGNEFIDYVMGHGALLLGHSHPAVVEAVTRQVALGTHYGANHELEVAWAESVCRLVPSAETVRFTSSGTEATLMALRIARAATGRPTVVKFERHFHGWHDYVVASSAYASRAPAGIPESTLESVIVIPPDLATVRETLASRPDVGCLVVEAAGAGSGSVPLPRGFNAALAEICRGRGVVFVMDEVVTGFRWSPGGVQALEGVRPDLTALAKVLAGGLPGGAVAGRADLLSRLAFPEPGSGAESREKIGHPGTFNANPASAAAGVSCLALAGTGEIQERAASRARQLRSGLNRVLRGAGIPGLVYGESSVFRLSLGRGEPPAEDDPDPGALPPEVVAGGTAPETQRLLNLALLNRGVQFFGNGGMTSSEHSEDDIARTVEAWGGALADLRNESVL